MPGRNKLSRVLRHSPCTPRQPGPPPKPPCPAANTLSPPSTGQNRPRVCTEQRSPGGTCRHTHPECPQPGVTALSTQRFTPRGCATLTHTHTETHTCARSQPPPAHPDPAGLGWAVPRPGRLHKQAGRRSRGSRAHAGPAHTHKPHGLTPGLAGARAPLQEEAPASRCLFPPLTPSLNLDPAGGPEGTHPAALRPQPREEDGGEDEESGALTPAAPRAGSGHLPGARGQMLLGWATRLTDATHRGLAPMSPCKAGTGASRAR